MQIDSFFGHDFISGLNDETEAHCMQNKMHNFLHARFRMSPGPRKKI